jgi:hypothetical protein
MGEMRTTWYSALESGFSIFFKSFTTFILKDHITEPLDGKDTEGQNENGVSPHSLGPRPALWTGLWVPQPSMSSSVKWGWETLQASLGVLSGIILPANSSPPPPSPGLSLPGN